MFFSDLWRSSPIRILIFALVVLFILIGGSILWGITSSSEPTNAEIMDALHNTGRFGVVETHKCRSLSVRPLNETKLVAGLTDIPNLRTVICSFVYTTTKPRSETKESSHVPHSPGGLVYNSSSVFMGAFVRNDNKKWTMIDPDSYSKNGNNGFPFDDSPPTAHTAIIDTSHLLPLSPPLRNTSYIPVQTHSMDSPHLIAPKERPDDASGDAGKGADKEASQNTPVTVPSLPHEIGTHEETPTFVEGTPSMEDDHSMNPVTHSLQSGSE